MPLGNRSLLEKAGVPASRIREMDWRAKTSLTVGDSFLTVTATPAQHFPGRSLTDRNRALWASWAMQWNAFSVWFGGDTSYNDVQIKKIGQRIGTSGLNARYRFTGVPSSFPPSIRLTLPRS